MNTAAELLANINTLEALKDELNPIGLDRLKSLKTAFKEEIEAGRYIVNGYKIRFNSFYDVYQVSHPKVGTCEEFKLLEQAQDYCKKG